MKKLILLTLIITFLFSCNNKTGIINTKPKDINDHPALQLSPIQAKAYYSTLVDSAMNKAADTDYLAMRLAYTRTKSYSPYSESEYINKIKELLEEGNYEVATEYIKSVYHKVFHKPVFHYYAFVAWKNLGEDKIAKMHSIYYDGLMKSIISNGNGKSIKTSWLVISVDEEYRVLEYLDMELISQSLVEKKSGIYDVMEVKDSLGNDKEIYFNIDIPFSELNE